MKTPRQGAAPAALLSLLILGCSESLVEPPEAVVSVPEGPSFNTAGAGPPLTGSGTWSATGVSLVSERVAGTNTIIENVIDIELEGALVGTAVHTNRIVIHGTTGTGTLQNTGEFTGTVAGCDAVESFTYRSVAKAQLDPPHPQIAEGKTFIVASVATDDVVLSGVMRWNQVGPGGGYDIEYACK